MCHVLEISLKLATLHCQYLAMLAIVNVNFKPPVMPVRRGGLGGAMGASEPPPAACSSSVQLGHHSTVTVLYNTLVSEVGSRARTSSTGTFLAILL